MSKQMAIKLIMRLIAKCDGGPLYEALSMAVDALEDQKRREMAERLNGGGHGKS